MNKTSQDAETTEVFFKTLTATLLREIELDNKFQEYLKRHLLRSQIKLFITCAGVLCVRYDSILLRQ